MLGNAYNFDISPILIYIPHIKIGQANMRALVDIPNDLIEDLAKLSAAKKLSRAEIIRQAITAFVNDNKLPTRESAFGLWSDTGVDGVAYQDVLREEW